MSKTSKTGCIARHINHVALAVSDLEETIMFYVQTFGVASPEVVELNDHGVKAALVRVGGSQLEFIQPLENTSGVASFIEKRGEGVHHICFEMDDLNQSLQKLEKAGINLIDKTARSGLSGEIAFIHPKSTGGVLIELVDSTSARR
ncbi:MAG: methylmalonyl-CoA epimerase [Dehalococcoidia bacterium]